MRKVRIPKRNGSYRTIYVPSRAQRKALRRLLPALEAAAIKLCPAGVVHGFLHGRSPVTNAMQHVGYAVTVCFDLSSFFDTVVPEMVLPKLADPLRMAVEQNCFVDGAARQGLPTSPMVSNIAASAMDWELENLLAKNGVAYTRYADDMTFSTNSEAMVETLLKTVPAIIAKHGFTVNEAKTHVQYAKEGRRNVTGVMVSDVGYYPQRKHKRRLRAALYQQQKNHAAGLAEWCKLKTPAGYTKDIQDAIQQASATWNACQDVTVLFH